jgi:hypothetical protein
LEIRTEAQPSSAVQCVFIGGPYTTASQVRPALQIVPEYGCTCVACKTTWTLTATSDRQRT